MINNKSTGGNDRGVAQAQRGDIYGRFVDVGAAFNQGLMMATKGGNAPTSNAVGSVKNNYEMKVESYLNKLPPDMDLGAIPEAYRGNIQEFLMNQKGNYVELANMLIQHEVGTPAYLELRSQMGGISNSMQNLKKQFDTYGANKKELLGDINENRTSLSIENQANVNLLAGVYNEEYPMNIDEFGNISFVGDDGIKGLKDLPGYENKAFGIATNMEKIALDAYTKGEVINEGDANFSFNKNNIKSQLQQGGRNSLMSVIYDGIVGNTKMIDNPIIAQNLQSYRDGDLSYDGLTDLVVDTYMDAVIENSKSGYKAKEVAAARRQRGSGGGNYNRSNRNAYKSPEFIYMEKYGGKVAVYAPTDPNGKVIIKTLDGQVVDVTPAKDWEDMTPQERLQKPTQTYAPTAAPKKDKKENPIVKPSLG